jgi:uncharacterized protein YndB with AHSA1/START domain
MSETLSLKKSISIEAPFYVVWEALTTPKLIKRYFYGTETQTDWKKGSPIIFSGEWDGKKYEDKGIIEDIEFEKFIKYKYWSSFSGTEDIPENYCNISYELTEMGDKTLFTVTQDGFKHREVREHSLRSWGTVMENLKIMLEQM